MDSNIVANLTERELIDFITGIESDGKGGYNCNKAGTHALVSIVRRLEKRKNEKRKRAPRRPNLVITNAHAEKVRQLAREHRGDKDWTNERISKQAGLYEKSIQKRKDKFWIDDWGGEYTLKQIAAMARLERDRAANGTFTAAEIAQMRMTNSLKYGDEDDLD